METSSNTDEKTSLETVASFLRYRDTFYQNADELIARGELRKASEMLWGAVTQSVKALAAASNVRISNHNQFFEFLRELCHELGDNHLYATFVELNDLHRNFYDEFIPKDAFQILHKKAFDFIRLIDELLRKRAEEQIRPKNRINQKRASVKPQRQKS